MALIRADVEAILVHRCGRLLKAAQLDGTTVSGANADLNDPIASAVKQLGGTVASRVSVADSDVATVDSSDEEALLDLAELRTLESIAGNLADVSVASSGDSLDLNDLARRVERRIDALTTKIQRQHGISLSTLSAGVIQLGFQQQDPCV